MADDLCEASRSLASVAGSVSARGFMCNLVIVRVTIFGRQTVDQRELDPPTSGDAVSKTK